MASVKTHCRHGHALTPDNIIIDTRRGHKKCKQCYRDKQARSRRKRQPIENANRRDQTSERKRLAAHVRMERDHHYRKSISGSRGAGDQTALSPSEREAT